MFESVTKKRKNPIINIFGWFLLTIVCVVFVFIGFSPNSGFLGRGGTAAEVNGEAISIRDFKESMDRMSSERQGDDPGSSRRIRENTINTLVSRSLIVQEAARMGIHVSDVEVAKTLMDVEGFYEEGVFSRVLYKTYLQQTRQTESEFEDRIRRDLLIQKMVRLMGFVSAEISVMDDFDEKVDQAQLNVDYILLNPKSMVGVSASAEAEAFLKEKEDEVKGYYDRHKSEFVVAEQVRARHILIKSEDETKESMDQALDEINKIKAKIRADNFSQMAKKYSQDPGSKDKGGDLGVFSRGRMVPEFDRLAFSSPPGQITEPLKTKYGYHILLVEEKTPAQEKSFDEVKKKIALKLKAKHRYDKFLSQIKKHLKEKSFKDLEKLFANRGLKWSETGYFNIIRDDIPGVGKNKEFLDLAMGLSPENRYANRLVYRGESAYILRFGGVRMDQSGKKSDQMNFFKQLVRRQKMNQMIQNWTNSLRREASVKINPKLIQ